MSEETFAVALGRSALDVAPPAVQPILFRPHAEMGGGEPAPDRLARFTEAQLDRLAEAAYLAIAVVEKELSREAFLELPFSVGELMLAFPTIARAAGLRPVSAELPQGTAAEAPRGLGESISTA